MSVLRGLRVVELSGSGAAAMATRQLADWGATVTILEPAGGTPLRGQPICYPAPDGQRSATWAWLSRGKTSVRVGPGTQVSTAAAHAFCQDADLVVAESELTLDVLGLEPAALRPFFERRTTCVLIAPFASDGPYAHYRASDLGIQALGGWVNLIGDPDREPLRPGNDMLPRVAGVFAFVAALVALRHERNGGTPQFVELSGQAVAASLIVAPWLMKSMYGIEQGRRRADWLHGGLLECADGWLGCTPLTATHWEMLCHMLGLDDVLQEPGGMEPPYRAEHAAELYRRVRPSLAKESKLDLFHQAQAWGIPAAPVEDAAERLACPQLAARGFFVEAEIDGRRLKLPRVATLIQNVPPVERGPLQESCALPAVAPRPARAAGARQAAPYAGLRVLDLTHFWAGPFATSLLGTLGADVIKIESIQRPDAYRYTLASVSGPRWYERGAVWNDTNCDKRDLTLDLGSADGRRLFEQLLATADVLVSNFSNRVLHNLGYTSERLLAYNPRLIIATLPGYGPGGPWENYAGYGIAFEQLAVCASITGYEGDVPRMMSGFADPIAGLHAVAGIEVALQRRERTGFGAVVEAPQCEILDSLFAPELIAVQLGAPAPGRRGNRHELMAPHNTYRVTGDDRWIAIAVGADAEFQALCAVLGRHEMAADPRFASAAARKQHEEDLDNLISAAVVGWDGRDLEQTLQAQGVMACRVARGWELPDDEGLAHIGFFQQLSRAVSGKHPYKTLPFRFSSIDTHHHLPPPTLGQHNAEVLHELLGLAAEELAGLEAGRIIGTAPVGVEP